MKIAVIGGGPGGYEAAIMAAKKGADVTLIEKNRVGGTCLNRGCIPTKALLASSEIIETIKEGKKLGVNITGDIDKDFEFMIDRKNKIVDRLVNGVEYLLKSAKVKQINGKGKLIDKTTVKIEKSDGTSETHKFDYIILATGSVPVCPELFKYDGKRIITSNEALDLKTNPESIIIVGGGVIGCEIGQFLNRMGTKVTIVEMQSQILPLEDKDVVKLLHRQFKKDKISVITGDGISSIEKNDDSVVANLQSGVSIKAEMMLVSIGRKGYTEGLGLENIGVTANERGCIITDKTMKTNIDNIYAIGDILDTPLLAHVASKEGLIAVENILGNKKEISYKAVPRCVYTNPELAAVGKTEAELKAENIEYKLGTFDFRSLGKSQATGKITGFIKIIADKNDIIIGASIIGDHATDLLTELSLAVHLGLTAEEVGDAIHPHPTLSEGIMEALHDVHNMAINKP